MGGEGIPAQLTKSARLGGDSETRTLKGPGEATWASRRAALAKLERAAFRSMGHFQQVHATALSTRSAESSSSDSFGSANRTRTQNLPVDRLSSPTFLSLLPSTSCFHRPPGASRIDLLVSANRAMNVSVTVSREKESHLHEYVHYRQRQQHHRVPHAGPRRSSRGCRGPTFYQSEATCRTDRKSVV